MISYEWLYILLGAFFAVTSLLSLRSQNIGNAAFWGLLAISFFFGSHMSDLMNGVLVLGLVAIAATGRFEAL